MTEKEIQGDYPLEIKFVDNRIYINYWDMIKGNHVNCEIKKDGILKFVFSSTEVEQAEIDGRDIDPLKQQAITIGHFCELVKESIFHSTKTE